MITLFFNQKGGVGKTALATETAGNLALAGKKVLLMDFDSQGNVAQTFGVNPFDKKGHDTHKVLIDYLINPSQGIETFNDIMKFERQKTKNLDILYGSMDLSSLELELFQIAESKGAHKTFEQVKQFFADIKKEGGYDAIIIDTSPTLGLFQASLVNATEFIIIPSAMEKFSQLGIIGIVESMGMIAEMLTLEQGDSREKDVKKIKKQLVNKIKMIVPMKVENVKDHKFIHEELTISIPKLTDIIVLPWEEAIPKATEFSRTIRESETTPVLKGSKNKATLAITSLIEKYFLS